MKKLLLLVTMLGTALAAHAAIYTTNWNSDFASGGAIPDNNLSGWSDTREVTTAPAGDLQGVAVNIQLSSGWVGDLFAYLVNDTGYAVLLDGVGQGTGSEPTFTYGYGAATWNIVLANDGFNGGSYTDIQSYGGGNLVSGIYNPASTDLTSFLSGSPNGAWSLFIADQSGGGLTTVQSWGLQLDIVAVPEPTTWAGLIFGGSLAAVWVARSQSVRSRIRRWRLAVNEWLDAA